MKQKLVREYEKRKHVFLFEKKQAADTLDRIYDKMNLIETEMKHCAENIKKEKENIAYHEQHASFKSAIEIKLSQSAIKQLQETLVTFGQIAGTLSTKIDGALADFNRAEKGFALCEACLHQLQQVETSNNRALFKELEELLQ